MQSLPLTVLHATRALGRVKHPLAASVVMLVVGPRAALGLAPLAILELGLFHLRLQQLPSA